MSALDLPEERESDLDRDLMKGIAQGDRNAFFRMFDRYAPTAMGLAWRILRHRHLAEEAVQETFLAVWRDPDAYRGEQGTVRAWLMSTVHHRAVDLVRHEESQSRRATEAAVVVATARGPADPGQVVVEEMGLAEDRKAVRRALEDLRPEQRQIIELMYFEGLSQTRIAERLSLPLGTVKSRARLAMRRLGASLGGLERSGDGDHPLGAATT
jgi:RNA polymerase sigma factor (sigma-70 family)